MDTDYSSEYGRVIEGERAVKYSTSKAFRDHVTRDPTDLTARGAFADYLEENDLHADADTLHHLRHTPGEVWVHEHEGKVRAGKKWTMPEIVKHVTDAGHHYFSPNTMRHFSSRLQSRVHSGPGGNYFVISSQSLDLPRSYEVVEFRDKPTPRDDRMLVGVKAEHKYHDTARQAHTSAHQLAHTVPAKS